MAEYFNIDSGKFENKKDTEKKVIEIQAGDIIENKVDIMALLSRAKDTDSEILIRNSKKFFENNKEHYAVLEKIRKLCLTTEVLAVTDLPQPKKEDIEKMILLRPVLQHLNKKKEDVKNALNNYKKSNN